MLTDLIKQNTLTLLTQHIEKMKGQLLLLLDDPHTKDVITRYCDGEIELIKGIK